MDGIMGGRLSIMSLVNLIIPKAITTRYGTGSRTHTQQVLRE